MSKAQHTYICSYIQRRLLIEYPKMDFNSNAFDQCFSNIYAHLISHGITEVLKYISDNPIEKLTIKK